jgi:hypothetical protein
MFRARCSVGAGGVGEVYRAIDRDKLSREHGLMI